MAKAKRAGTQAPRRRWSWSRSSELSKEFDEICLSLARCKAAKLPEAIAAAVEQVRELPVEPISEASMAGCPMFFEAPHEWVADLIAGRPQPRLAVARILMFLSSADPKLLTRVAACPDLTSLEGLRVEHPQQKPLDVEPLSALAPRLRWLRLMGCGVDEQGARALGKMRFDRLEALYLPKNPIGPAGVAALVQLDAPGLRWLHLPRTEAGVEGATALAASPLPARLELLSLAEDAIGDAGLLALARREDWAALRSLSLVGNRITDVEPLAASSMARSLEKLDLTGNPIGDRGLAQIAPLSSLRDLSLYDCGIGPAGARALAASRFRLRSLILSGNPIGDEGVAELARSEALSEVRSLDLCTVGMTDAGVRALAAAPWISRLEHLDIEQHTDAVTDEGWEVLKTAMKRKRTS